MTPCEYGAGDELQYDALVEVSIRRIAEVGQSSLELPTECKCVPAVADATTVVDTKQALTSWHSQTKAEADVNLKRVARRR
jgi:hypothetical protein